MKAKLNKKTGKVKIMSKSQAAHEASEGKDMGAKGKNFSKIAESAGAKYHSAEAGKKVAGAIFQNLRKAGKL